MVYDVNQSSAMSSNPTFQDVQESPDPSPKWQAGTFLQNGAGSVYPVSVIWLAEIICSQWNQQCGERSLCWVLFLINLFSMVGYRTSVLSHSPAHHNLPCQQGTEVHDCRSKVMFGWTFLSTLDFLLVEHFLQGNILTVDNLEKNQTFPGKALEQITSKGHKFLPRISPISEQRFAKRFARTFAVPKYISIPCLLDSSDLRVSILCQESLCKKNFGEIRTLISILSSEPSFPYLPLQSMEDIPHSRVGCR